MPQEVQRIALISSVHDTEHHHIGMFGVMSMYICKGNLEPQAIHIFREFPRSHGAVVLGELTRVDGNWQFASDGETVEGGLRELCGRYSVRLEDDEAKVEGEKSGVRTTRCRQTKTFLALGLGAFLNQTQ